MGCYPIGKIISKAITKCNGGEERRRSISPVYNVTYSPPPMYQTSTMAKTVTFSENNSVYIIPNEPARSPTTPETHMVQPESSRPLPAQPKMQKSNDPVPVKGRARRHNRPPDMNQSEPIQNRPVRIVHGPHPPGFNHAAPSQNQGEPRVVHGPHPPGFNQAAPGQNQGGPRVVHGPHPPGFNQAAHGQNQGGPQVVHGPHPLGFNQAAPGQNQGGPRVVHGPHPPGFNQAAPAQNQGGSRVIHAPHSPSGFNQAEPGQSGSNQHESKYGHEYGYGRYVPSPLPRWQATPKRHEYFSGEYRYYPTPVREGIYNIATDPNRLTSIFSEENPNACTIS